MDKKLSIDKLNELLKLRNLLHVLNQQTFSYATLNKKYPIETITSDDAEVMIQAYKDILDNIRKQLETV